MLYAQDSGGDGGDSGPIICNNCNTDSDARDAADGKVDVGDDRYVYNPSTGAIWLVINHIHSGISVTQVTPPSQLPPGGGPGGIGGGSGDDGPGGPPSASDCMP